MACQATRESAVHVVRKVSLLKARHQYTHARRQLVTEKQLSLDRGIYSLELNDSHFLWILYRLGSSVDQLLLFLLLPRQQLLLQVLLLPVLEVLLPVDHLRSVILFKVVCKQ